MGVIQSCLNLTSNSTNTPSDDQLEEEARVRSQAEAIVKAFTGLELKNDKERAFTAELTQTIATAIEGKTSAADMRHVILNAIIPPLDEATAIVGSELIKRIARENDSMKEEISRLKEEISRLKDEVERLRRERVPALAPPAAEL